MRFYQNTPPINYGRSLDAVRCQTTNLQPLRAQQLPPKRVDAVRLGQHPLQHQRHAILVVRRRRNVGRCETHHSAPALDALAKHPAPAFDALATSKAVAHGAARSVAPAVTASVSAFPIETPTPAQVSISMSLVPSPNAMQFSAGMGHGAMGRWLPCEQWLQAVHRAK